MRSVRPGEVAAAVAVGVQERLDVEAVDDRVLPPQVARGLGLHHPCIPTIAFAPVRIGETREIPRRGGEPAWPRRIATCSTRCARAACARARRATSPRPSAGPTRARPSKGAKRAVSELQATSSRSSSAKRRPHRPQAQRGGQEGGGDAQAQGHPAQPRGEEGRADARERSRVARSSAAPAVGRGIPPPCRPPASTPPTRRPSPPTSGGSPSATTSPHDVCDKHPADKLAMIHEDVEGNVREVHWGELQELSNRFANVLRAHGVEQRRPRRDAAPADARDRRRVLRHLQVGRDPALDVRPLRRRRHPPSGEGLAGQGARHERGQPAPHRSGARRRGPGARRRAAAERRAGVRRRRHRRRRPRAALLLVGHDRARQGHRARAPLPARARGVRVLPRRAGRRALPRHGRVGVGGGHRAAARARGATAPSSSCSSARAASTRTSSSTSSRATRRRTSSRRRPRCAR